MCSSDLRRLCPPPGRRRAESAGIGGMFTWSVYLAAYGQIHSYFFSNLIASIFVAAYAEFMARINKAPSTIFLTASAIPLIPGANLYNTMHGIVRENYKLASTNGVTTLGPFSPKLSVL